MSAEEQMAAIGRLATERAQAKKEQVLVEREVEKSVDRRVEDVLRLRLGELPIGVHAWVSPYVLHGSEVSDGLFKERLGGRFLLFDIPDGASPPHARNGARPKGSR